MSQVLQPALELLREIADDVMANGGSCVASPTGEWILEPDTDGESLRIAEIDHRTVLEAIGLSHIITAYVKAFTGRLSAICGCSVAAGAGATAGVTYLMGGTKHHIAGAIKNLTEDLAGVICDGAKIGCAMKCMTGVDAAFRAAYFARHDIGTVVAELPGTEVEAQRVSPEAKKRSGGKQASGTPLASPAVRRSPGQAALPRPR